MTNHVLAPLGLRLVDTAQVPEPVDLATEGFTIPHSDLRVRAHRGKIDGRPSELPALELSVLVEDLAALIDRTEFSGSRVLEIGPKYGHHTRWLDSELRPAYLCLVDRNSDVDHSYVERLTSPHAIWYEDVVDQQHLRDQEPFDLIVATGILYHNVEQFRLLAKLWSVARPGALMVFECSTTGLEQRLRGNEAAIELRWHGERNGSYMMPSKSALFTMLAMTGWNDIDWYPDFRTIPSSVLLTCRRAEERPRSHLGSPFGIP